MLDQKGDVLPPLPKGGDGDGNDVDAVEEVDRQRIGNDVYDVWTYIGRGSFYFENGVLFKRPDQAR